MSIRVTQIGNEVWVRNPSFIRVTQIGNEVWVLSGGKIRVTNIGVNVWRTVAGSPLTITGNADGYATAWAISSMSVTTTGNADGNARVHMTKTAPAPLIAFMGI